METLIEDFKNAGCSVEVVQSVFSSERFKRKGFAEYVLKRLKQSSPINSDNWLKTSTRYCLKAFQKLNTPEAIEKKRSDNKRRSETITKTIEHKKEVDKTQELRIKFDNLSDIEKQVFYNKAKDDGAKFPYLIKLNGFLFFCQERISKDGNNKKN